MLNISDLKKKFNEIRESLTEDELNYWLNKMEMKENVESWYEKHKNLSKSEKSKLAEEMEEEYFQITEKVQKERDKYMFSNLEDFSSFNNESWDKFYSIGEDEMYKASLLNIKRHLIVEYKLEDIDDIGDVMSIEKFISYCEIGGFIPSDGFGYYVKGNKMSNVEISPKYVTHGIIRKDFDKVIWYNK